MTRQNWTPIDLDQAMAGMVLSEAVTDEKRGILLPRGAALTDAAIASLRRRGVQKLSVVGDAARAVEDWAARERKEKEAQEQALARLHRLFRKSGDRPPARMLFDCLSRYRLERKGSGD